MRKLLIIDDESSIRFTIEDVLASEDLEVVGAETAEEGVRLAAELLPALVLLDVRSRQTLGAGRVSRATPLRSQESARVYHRPRQREMRSRR